MAMDLCGDDLDALRATIVSNLDKVAAAGQRALLVLVQGTNLPPSWLASCEKYTLATDRFSGTLCVPWDATYQANLRHALADVIGPAVKGHPALAGVYFTITTMTNGVEMHFRVDKASFPYPGDEPFRAAYDHVMDTFQAAFTVPVVFEAGHCLWLSNYDCETPRRLYRHSREKYGVAKSGIALWNCAERFWAGATGAGGETFGAKALIEEASADGASVGCQTVGSFTRGACRFSSAEVGNYGDRGTLTGDTCPSDPNFNPAGACVDTMRWFSGIAAKATVTAKVKGTWAENWSADHGASGVYRTGAECKAAIDLVK